MTKVWFARDLHDLLGYSLSAITLKTELTHRLVSQRPEQAQHELVEILAISRKALAELRSVASGYRGLSPDVIVPMASASAATALWPSAETTSATEPTRRRRPRASCVSRWLLASVPDAAPLIPCAASSGANA
jgi:Histidine kinase